MNNIILNKKRFDNNYNDNYELVNKVNTEDNIENINKEDLKNLLKKEMSELLFLKINLDKIKKEYKEIKTVYSDKEEIIKYYMKLLEIEDKKISYGSDDDPRLNTDWQIKIKETQTSFLTKKILMESLSNEEFQFIWNLRKKNIKNKLECKEI
jgi:hypothetical protein